jgi:predicted RNA-binding Zn ribbon-like protein
MGEARGPAPTGSRPGLPPLFGGSLCLDFANTVEPRWGDDRRDYLLAYSDLARWGRHVGILTSAQEQRLLEAAARRPRAAEATAGAAIGLREGIYRAFAAVAGQRQPAAADLALLQQAYAEAARHARIVPAAGSLTWAWDEAAVALDRVLWPVARSAVELALSGRLERVKQCPVPAGGCGWLFFDATKNSTRRWCSMRDCGGRVKARRQYARRRAARAAGEVPS